MLSIYLFCLAIGGIFVALSTFAGFDGADFDHDFDADMEFTDIQEGEGHSQIQKRRRRGFWIPLFSLKFWTFGSCFFGLTGILLFAIQPSMPSAIAIAISLAIGLFCGTAMASAMHALQRRKVDSMVRSSDLIGLSGTVEIPFDKNSKGKVRLNVKGSLVDFVAFTEEAKDFARGEKAFIVGMEKNKIWVVSEDSLAVSTELNS